MRLRSHTPHQTKCSTVSVCLRSCPVTSFLSHFIMKTAVYVTALIAAFSAVCVANAAEQLTASQFNTQVAEGDEAYFVKFYGACASQLMVSLPCSLAPP